MTPLVSSSFVIAQPQRRQLAPAPVTKARPRRSASSPRARCPGRAVSRWARPSSSTSGGNAAGARRRVVPVVGLEASDVGRQRSPTVTLSGCIDASGRRRPGLRLVPGATAQRRAMRADQRGQPDRTLFPVTLYLVSAEGPLTLAPSGGRPAPGSSVISGWM